MAIRFYGVDDSQVDVTEKKSTSLNDKTGWYYGPDYEYTEVAVSSAEILTMGSSPVELLPAPGVNKYYDIDMVILEFTHGSTAYTITDEIALQLNQWKSIGPDLIISGTDTHTIIKDMYNHGVDAVENQTVNNQEVANIALTLGTFGESNPTLGDGTLLVKIWYKVKTFGTEL